MRVLGLLLVATLPLVSQGFDRTRWGMAEAEVEACYPGRTWSPTCSDGTRSISQVKLEQDLDGVKVKVDFYFTDNRLDNVEIAPAAGPRPLAGALAVSRQLVEGLVRRLGVPQVHEGPAEGLETFRWRLEGTEVCATRALTATDCVFNIQYLPRRPGPAGLSQPPTD